jgi:hypothetical protein
MPRRPTRVAPAPPPAPRLRAHGGTGVVDAPARAGVLFERCRGTMCTVGPWHCGWLILSRAGLVMSPDGNDGSAFVDQATEVLNEQLAIAPPPSSLFSRLLNEKALRDHAGSPGEELDLRVLVEMLLRLLDRAEVLPGIADVQDGSARERFPSPIPETALFDVVAVTRQGETTELIMGVINDDADKSVHIKAACADLVARPDRRIAAERIAFTPTELVLPAGGSADVVIRVDVPFDASRGSYSGLLRPTKLGGSPAHHDLPSRVGPWRVRPLRTVHAATRKMPARHASAWRVARPCSSNAPAAARWAPHGKVLSPVWRSARG